MKTKREVLEIIAKYKGCCLSCCDCPYSKHNTGIEGSCIARRLEVIGAMAILRQNRKKREFNPNKVLTSVTTDKAKVGMKGCFADSLANMKFQFATKRVQTLLEITGEEDCARFVDGSCNSWCLFYPIGEDEE